MIKILTYRLAARSTDNSTVLSQFYWASEIRHIKKNLIFSFRLSSDLVAMTQELVDICNGAFLAYGHHDKEVKLLSESKSVDMGTVYIISVLDQKDLGYYPPSIEMCPVHSMIQKAEVALYKWRKENS